MRKRRHTHGQIIRVHTKEVVGKLDGKTYHIMEPMAYGRRHYIAFEEPTHVDLQVVEGAEFDDDFPYKRPSSNEFDVNVLRGTNVKKNYFTKDPYFRKTGNNPPPTHTEGEWKRIRWSSIFTASSEEEIQGIVEMVKESMGTLYTKRDLRYYDDLLPNTPRGWFYINRNTPVEVIS